MEAVTAGQNGDLQMIDSSSVRVHQHAANTRESGEERCMGRSRGGLTTKIHALTDSHGLPLELGLTPGQAADCPTAARLLGRLREGTIPLADKAYDAVWLRRSIEAAGAAPNIPAKVTRRWRACFSAVLYRERNLGRASGGQVTEHFETKLSPLHRAVANATPSPFEKKKGNNAGSCGLSLIARSAFCIACTSLPP